MKALKLGVTGMFPVGAFFVAASVAVVGKAIVLVEENGHNSPVVDLPLTGIRTMDDVYAVTRTMVDAPPIHAIPVTLPAHTWKKAHDLEAFVEKMLDPRHGYTVEQVVDGLRKSYIG